MTFAHPAALLGLLAALAPITVYLLLRRRRTEVAWGASYLLRLTLASKRKTSVWLQYVILAMRTLLLAALALAVAQPRFANPTSHLTAPAPPPGPVHRVVLLDHSLSMTVASGPVSRWSRQQQALRGLLEAQRPGDRLDLVSLLTPATPLPQSTFSGRLDSATVTAGLDALPVREGALHLHAALVTAMTRLAETPDAAAEIYLFSDYPQEVLADLERLSWFRETAAGRDVKVVAVRMTAPGEVPPVSVAVTDVGFGSDLVPAGLPVQLHITLTNHADRETAAEVRVVGEHLPTAVQAVVLQANETRRVALPLRFDAPGVDLLHIQVTPGGLPAASEMWLSVEVQPRLKVWLIADEPGAGGVPVGGPGGAGATLGEAEFLRRAWGSDSGAPIDLVEVPMNQVATDIPADVDAILIAGPRVVTPAVLAPLTAFVGRGGGLIVGLGPSANIQFYNEALGSLLPATLGEPAVAEVDPERYQSMKAQPIDADQLWLAELGDADSGNLGAPRFYNHLRVSDLKPDATRLFDFDDGSPLLLTRPVGRGHVVLYTSSFGVSWSSLAVHQGYLPLLYRLLQVAASGRGTPRNLAADAPFVMAWPDAEPATLTTPEAREVAVTPSVSAAGTYIVLPAQGGRGAYRLRGTNAGDAAATSSHATSFTVRGAPAEADLRGLDATQQTRLSERVGATLYADWPSAVAALGAADAERALWPWLLALIAVLYLVESRLVRLL